MQLGAVRAHQTSQRIVNASACTSRPNALAARLHRPVDGVKLGSVSFVSGKLIAKILEYKYSDITL